MLYDLLYQFFFMAALLCGVFAFATALDHLLDVWAEYRAPKCIECGAVRGDSHALERCADCCHEGARLVSHPQYFVEDEPECCNCGEPMFACTCDVVDYSMCEECGQDVIACICGTEDEIVTCGGCLRRHDYRASCDCGYDYEPIPFDDPEPDYLSGPQAQCDGCGGQIGSNPTTCDLCNEWNEIPF